MPEIYSVSCTPASVQMRSLHIYSRLLRLSILAGSKTVRSAILIQRSIAYDIIWFYPDSWCYCLIPTCSLSIPGDRSKSSWRDYSSNRWHPHATYYRQAKTALHWSSVDGKFPLETMACCGSTSCQRSRRNHQWVSHQSWNWDLSKQLVCWLGLILCGESWAI